MTKRLILVLLLIVCLPLVFLGWIGVRLARDEQDVIDQRFREVLIEKLQDTDQTIVRYFERCEREFLELTELSSFEPSQIRQIVHSQPRVTQLFVLERDGQLLHPSPESPLSASELEFLRRAQPFLQDKDLVRESAPESSPGGNVDGQLLFPNARVERSRLEHEATDGRAQTHGWYVWYWGRGLNLVFWKRLETQHVVGIELDRSRWIADLIAELPHTASADQVPASQSRIRLVDSNENVVYQWGVYEPPEDASPFVAVPVSEPLASWRLSYFVSDQHLTSLSGRSIYFNVFTGLTAVTLVLIGLAVYFYRESSREMREAATRVNFVNQVSHELRTPLTNIRLYADLLENDLSGLDPDAAQVPQQRLEVIVAESQRLSRLLGNVLAFAKQQRGQITLNVKPVNIDAIIGNVIRQFEPMMRQKGIDVRFQAGAEEPVRCDVDALEQILVNLFSNVEKYAADGRQVEITTSRKGDITTVLVADQGRGIPPHLRERVFQPFYRLSHQLEGAAGAGIGLAIVRNLARLHGGDVSVIDSETGATIRVDLHTPRPDDQPATT